MEVFVTPSARQHLKKLEEVNPSSLLMISVESGGCGGFQYIFSMHPLSGSEKEILSFLRKSYKEIEAVHGSQIAESELEKKAVILDQKFILKHTNWVIFQIENNSDSQFFMIEDVSLPFLKNITIEYEKTMIGESFQIKNHQASSKCGCGKSFSV